MFRYDPAWKKKVLGIENGAAPGKGCPRDPDQDLLKVLGQGLVYTGRKSNEPKGKRAIKIRRGKHLKVLRGQSYPWVLKKMPEVGSHRKKGQDSS